MSLRPAESRFGSERMSNCRGQRGETALHFAAQELPTFTSWSGNRMMSDGFSLDGPVRNARTRPGSTKLNR